MDKNLFGNFKNVVRSIDGRTATLDVMWESLSNILGYRGIGKNIQETDKQLRNIQSTVRNIRDEMQESSDSIGIYIDGMEQFLNDCQLIYDDFIQEIEELEPWLSESGYLPPDSISTNGDVEKE